MKSNLVMASVEKTVRIVDPKGKVLAELTKILKDMTVEEFKKALVKFNLFRKTKCQEQLHMNR